MYDARAHRELIKSLSCPSAVDKAQRSESGLITSLLTHGLLLIFLYSALNKSAKYIWTSKT